ncbi:hypothetical protein GE09DRAFT_176234 [Coniochaeta sp. 2T2.1]|nr:hypothetical protein GE09DRAFT_176234 [Coniochaeta sp. 2T2.1]
MVQLLTLSVALAYAFTTLAAPAPSPAGSTTVDTSKAGSANVGKGNGLQFITGQCFSNADCASTCCNKNTGLCNAIGAVGIENCGFNAGGPAAAPAPAPTNAAAAPATANPAIDSSRPGSQNVGKADGSQFITGQCFSNADCASACCNKDTGNCNAIGAVGIDKCGFQAGGGAGAAAPPVVAAPAANTPATSANPGIDASLPGSQNVGKADGSQFITGQCLSNADCASTCCNKNTGKCSAIGAVGLENCGFGGDASSPAPAPITAPAAGNGAVAANPAIDSSLPGSQNVGKANGSQFITGQCFSNADCASTCCNKDTGKCNAIGAVGIEKCGFQLAA